jgi:hypothetical protein
MVPSSDAADPALSTITKVPIQVNVTRAGGGWRPRGRRIRAGTVSLRAERSTHTGDKCRQLPLPFHACTGRASSGNGEFNTASCSNDTEVDLVQADGRWKLCYSTSAGSASTSSTNSVASGSTRRGDQAPCRRLSSWLWGTADADQETPVSRLSPDRSS